MEKEQKNKLNELKITVSFRIRPMEREEIVEIGNGSFSKGVSTILNFYKGSSGSQKDESWKKLDEAQRKINEIISKLGGENAETRELQKELNAVKAGLIKREMKNTKVLFKDLLKKG